MRAFGFLFLLLLIETTSGFVHLGYLDRTSPTSSCPGTLKAFEVNNRKLKANNVDADSENEDQINLEDYRPIDPVPSSKASIRHGPIQHDTPLMPYIPRVSPPPIPIPIPIPVPIPVPPGKPKRGGCC